MKMHEVIADRESDVTHIKCISGVVMMAGVCVGIAEITNQFN